MMRRFGFPRILDSETGFPPFLQGFMANDDVRAMHKAKSPDCKFVKEDAAKPAPPQVSCFTDS